MITINIVIQLKLIAKHTFVIARTMIDVKGGWRMIHSQTGLIVRCSIKAGHQTWSLSVHRKSMFLPAVRSQAHQLLIIGLIMGL